jgi:putative serine protease PepD
MSEYQYPGQSEPRTTQQIPTWTLAPAPVTVAEPVPPVPPPAERPRNGGVRRAVVATVAGAAIALTAGGVGGFVGYSLHDDGSPLQTFNNDSQAAAPAVDRSSLAKIAADVQPAVVVIQTGSGEGSGVIISEDGYIVTNNHVVATARGDSVQVVFNSGKRVTASVVGTDPKTDLAVVKASDATGLKAATWGNSDSVQVGDTVLAIGSPLGLQGSVTAGIVSALHRTITVGDEQRSQFDVGGSRTTIGDAIQTDAPINPGNSGGALVNLNGEVIGINSAIATSGSNGNIGVGFAISANRAKSVADQLIKGGKVSHPFLGVSVADAENGGARIAQIEPGGPAEQAGLRVGDVVTKIGDRQISGMEDLIGAIQAATVGTPLPLTVVRDGSETAVNVVPVEAP